MTTRPVGTDTPIGGIPANLYHRLPHNPPPPLAGPPPIVGPEVTVDTPVPPDMVAMTKWGQVIHVHTSTAAEHIAAGWSRC